MTLKLLPGVIELKKATSSKRVDISDMACDGMCAFRCEGMALIDDDSDFGGYCRPRQYRGLPSAGTNAARLFIRNEEWLKGPEKTLRISNFCQ